MHILHKNQQIRMVPNLPKKGKKVKRPNFSQHNNVSQLTQNQNVSTQNMAKSTHPFGANSYNNKHEQQPLIPIIPNLPSISMPTINNNCFAEPQQKRRKLENASERNKQQHINSNVNMNINHNQQNNNMIPQIPTISPIIHQSPFSNMNIQNTANAVNTANTPNIAYTKFIPQPQPAQDPRFMISLSPITPDSSPQLTSPRFTSPHILSPQIVPPQIVSPQFVSHPVPVMSPQVIPSQIIPPQIVPPLIMQQPPTQTILAQNYCTNNNNTNFSETAKTMRNSNNSNQNGNGNMFELSKFSPSPIFLYW